MQNTQRGSGDIIMNSGRKLIDTIVKIVGDFSSAYKSRNAQEYEEALLIKLLKNPSAYTYLPLGKAFLDAYKNAAQLLEGFEAERMRNDLNLLLNDIITDYEFADNLIAKQIEPALNGLVGPISEFEFTPYFLY